MSAVSRENNNPTIKDLMGLVQSGQDAAKQRWEDLRGDFESKHAENRERRHAIMGKVEQVEGRVHVHDGRIGSLEAKLFSIVGDNSGDSGLLHKIDGKVDALQAEIQAIKTTVQDTPAINKWVYGAMAVAALAVIVFVALGGPLIIELLKALAAKH